MVQFIYKDSTMIMERSLKRMLIQDSVANYLLSVSSFVGSSVISTTEGDRFLSINGSGREFNLPVRS